MEQEKSPKELYDEMRLAEAKGQEKEAKNKKFKKHSKITLWILKILFF